MTPFLLVYHYSPSRSTLLLRLALSYLRTLNTWIYCYALFLSCHRFISPRFLFVPLFSFPSSQSRRQSANNKFSNVFIYSYATARAETCKSRSCSILYLHYRGNVVRIFILTCATLSSFPRLLHSPPIKNLLSLSLSSRWCFILGLSFQIICTFILYENTQ